MIEKESIPFAPHLIESMRSLGYSFETAIADLIDNSISAKASKIDLFLTPNENPQLIIFDNGCGMYEHELEEALRYGSKGPLEERTETDLGRFGLGLKSASLSQCRKLVVASKKGNKISCFSWDLDHIIDKKGWVLLQYNEVEINKLPMIDLFDEVNTGTYILLENFDRVSSSTFNLSSTINNYMNLTIDHLALVYHRFLDEGVSIYVNNNKIIPRDPFLKNHKSTIIAREQNLDVEGSKIKIKPFILPHINKLTKEDFDKVGGKEDLKSNQGFYVYRNKRLIIWGTWFRLTRKDELSKLARILVDIPNTLDYMWSIDIKKSSASLPDIIKKNLYSAIDESIFKSKNVHEYRGRRQSPTDNINYIWERLELRNGAYEYKINRNIPQIKILEESLDSEQIKMLDGLIDGIENSFPSSSIYLDVSKGEIKENIEFNIEELYDQIKQQVQYCENLGMDKLKAIKTLLNTEPYCYHKELKEKFECELEVLI